MNRYHLRDVDNVTDLRLEDDGEWVQYLDAQSAINSAVAAERERVRVHASKLIHIAAKMLNLCMPEDVEEWSFPKTMPKRMARKIISEAEKWNSINRRRSREIKEVFDEITNTNPPAGDRRGETI